MGRYVEYDEAEICDECGRVGAFDFQGDCLCPRCADKEGLFPIVEDDAEDEDDEDFG